MMYIESIRLENLKSFESFELQLDLKRDQLPLTVLLGDNATGKSAFLRAIALALCDESSASGLMKESDEGYIRRSSDGPAKIELVLRRAVPPRRKYVVTTEITRIESRHGALEGLRQTTRPKRNFPWQEVFACAYGAGRGTAGTGDISGYSAINALYNMFNYGEGLQNPELTLRRLASSADRVAMRKLIASVAGVDRVHVAKTGITVDGAWGEQMPLRDLSDGYQSTMLWITDFLGWAIAFERSWKSASKITGIVLLDEIEQHLHPQWQQTIVDDLRTRFPRVQFIATTHSPLVAASVGRLGTSANPDKLLSLELVDGATVEAQEHAPMRGWDVDQILASSAFDYLVRSDPEMTDVLRRASVLAGRKKKLTSSENRELLRLKEVIADQILFEGDTPIEQQLKREFVEFMRARMKSGVVG